MIRLSHYPGAGMEHPRILSVLYRCLLGGLAREHIGMATGSMVHGMRSKSRRIYSGKNYVTWGHCWAGKKMMAHYYNQAGCDIWRRGSSRKRDLMVLIRSLYDIAAS